MKHPVIYSLYSHFSKIWKQYTIFSPDFYATTTWYVYYISLTQLQAIIVQPANN